MRKLHADPVRSAAVRHTESLLAAGYLLPALVVLLTFQVLPIFYAFYISLHRWGLAREAFLGWGNYGSIFSDQEFRQSLATTLWFVLGTVPTGILLGLGIALLLHGELRGRAAYRALYFLPYVTSVVAAAMAWSWIYNPQYGILNFVLARLHVPPQQWLIDPRGVFQIVFGHGRADFPCWLSGPSLALVAVTITTVWSGLGFNVIVLLAGLTGISSELQEAARVDGAGIVDLFRFVTLPLLAPVTFFLLVVNTIRAFQAFNQIYVMTSPTPGGPLGTTQVVTVYIFRTFYERANIGYGAALAFGLFLILLVLTLAQFRLAADRVTYG